MNLKASKSSKNLKKQLNPQKQVLTKEQLIMYETFLLTTTEKAHREIKQCNDLYDVAIEDIEKQIQLIKMENQELQYTLNANKNFFEQLKDRKQNEEQLYKETNYFFEILQKNKEKSLELKKQFAQLQKIQQKLTKRIQQQNSFKLESQKIIKHKKQQVKQMRIEGQWQEKEMARLYKLLNNCEIQNEELFTLKKKLNNELQQLKGNIRVYCRIRPSKFGTSSVSVTSDNSLKITYDVDRVKSQPQKFQQGYMFEQIFEQKQTQKTIFNQMSQLIHSAVDGKNVCIFAYGQTGSGKTFTLLGSTDEQIPAQVAYEHRGLAQRSIQLIFKQITVNEKFQWRYRVFLSIQEIYLQGIIDLTPKKDGQIEVTNALQILALMKEASLHRKTGATNMNERSSRSHLIISIRLEGVSEKTKDKRNGSLVFVDLAGSQRLKQSKVVGDMLKQTLFINKSLSTLGTVINEMRRNSEHISFRNSKLTHTLQKYLKGQSKTVMFVNISPDPDDVFQTKISLGFAESVSQCTVKK